MPSREDSRIQEEIERLSQGKYRTYKEVGKSSTTPWVIYNNESREICKRCWNLESCLKWVKERIEGRISPREAVRKLSNNSLRLVRKKNGKYLLIHNRTDLILETSNRPAFLVDLVRKEYCFPQ